MFKNLSKKTYDFESDINIGDCLSSLESEALTLYVSMLSQLHQVCFYLESLTSHDKHLLSVSKLLLSLEVVAEQLNKNHGLLLENGIRTQTLALT